jgi:3-hydroxyacyl-[acyl-carrier-protein] dehydratase
MTQEQAQSPIEIDEIKRLLPHRYPLLLVDRVDDFRPREWLVGCKKISPEEPVLAGHFPGNPIYPGVYIIEGMAQASALLSFKTYEADGTKYKNEVLLASVEKSRFRKMVLPGSVLYYKVTFKRQRGAWVWCDTQAEVDGEIVAEASISARTVLV